MSSPSPLVLAKGSIDGVQRPRKIPQKMRGRDRPLCQRRIRVTEGKGQGSMEILTCHRNRDPTLPAARGARARVGWERLPGAGTLRRPPPRKGRGRGHTRPFCPGTLSRRGSPWWGEAQGPRGLWEAPTGLEGDAGQRPPGPAAREAGTARVSASRAPTGTGPGQWGAGPEGARGG